MSRFTTKGLLWCAKEMNVGTIGPAIIYYVVNVPIKKANNVVYRFNSLSGNKINK